MLNGITVYCDGKARELELDKRQAEKFFWYAGVASESESVGPQPDHLPPAEVKDRIRRSNTVEEGAASFKTYLSMIAGLSVRQLALVISFLDLIEYGESWMLETINDLLREVLCAGPAKANEQNPRDVLADTAYDLFDWWDNIDTARSHAAQHPRLFTPQPEPTAPITAARQRPTRKSRKAPIHA